MKRATMKQLTETRGEPAVSILCPLDTRRPGNPHDPRVLAGLRDQAVEGIEAVLRGREASSLIARIDDAITSVDLEHPSPGIAVLVAVWQVARDGRGHRLVVEDGFRFNARVVEGALEAAPEGEAGAFDAVDDVVDAVIRQGGEVVPMRAGSLSDLGQVALLVRY
jgi:hypothetical protein